MPNGLVAGGAVTVAPQANTGLIASPVQRAFGIEDAVEIKPIKLVMYAKEDVDVRKGPGTGYDISIALDKGDKVIVTGVCTNGWYRINVDKKEYYVQRKFLSASKPTGEDDASVTTEEDEIYLPDEPTVTTEEDEIYLPDESSIVTAPVITVTYPTNPTYTLPIVTTTTPAETTVTTTTPAETTVTTTTPAVTTVTTTTPVVTTVTTTEPVPSEPDSFEVAKAFMKMVGSNIQTNIPDKGYQDPASNGNAKNIIPTTYYSDIAGHDKRVWIQLPYGYDESKEYPVLYVLHGIWSDETTMVNSWQTNDIIDNMTAEGLAEEMIVVYPMMYTDPDRLKPDDNMEMADAVPGYDAIVEDILCLMDYMSANYSVAEGKDNTAIFGFSMGGREALAIGFTYPDKFGYVGAACPAPGLVYAIDWAMEHPGQFQEDEIRFTDEMPYLVLIGAGDQDVTVGQFPQSYHDLMVKNGVEHLFYIIPGSGHGDPAIASVTYNFCKYVFKAK